jgi:hypothetical protein
VLYPIGRIRLKSHAAVLRLKEIESGFRVLSAEAAPVESLESEEAKTIRGMILSNQIKEPEKITGFAIFFVEHIDSAKPTSYFCTESGFGDYSRSIPGVLQNLNEIQESALYLKDRRIDLINVMNKESDPGILQK